MSRVTLLLLFALVASLFAPALTATATAEASYAQAQDPPAGVPQDWGLNKNDKPAEMDPKEVKNNNPDVTKVKVTNGKNSSKVTVSIYNANGELIDRDTLKPGDTSGGLDFPPGSTMEIAPAITTTPFEGANGTYVAY